MSPYQRVAVGTTGLEITQLGLGGGPLGGLFKEVTDSTASATLDRAWNLGVRLFDTAPLYGFGLSERRLGFGLRHRPREQFVLSTKVGRLVTPGSRGTASDAHERLLWKGSPTATAVFDFSDAGVMRSLEGSLNRLALDRVDIVYLHDPNKHHAESLRGAFTALDRLRSEGTIRAVGVGTNEWRTLTRFARDQHFDCFLLAGRYTILDQSALTTLLPLCVQRGISVIAGGIFNSGILADPRRSPTFDYRPASRAWIDKTQRLASICERHDVPLKAAAIQFPLGHPAIISVLIGCQSADEVEENARMFAWTIPEAMWCDLRAEGLIAKSAPHPPHATRTA